jgi:hypothetical protein
LNGESQLEFGEAEVPNPDMRAFAVVAGFDMLEGCAADLPFRWPSQRVGNQRGAHMPGDGPAGDFPSTTRR